MGGFSAMGGDFSGGGCGACDVQPWPNRHGYLGVGIVCGCDAPGASVACPSGPLPPGDGAGGVHDFQFCE